MRRAQNLDAREGGEVSSPFTWGRFALPGTPFVGIETRSTRCRRCHHRDGDAEVMVAAIPNGAECGWQSGITADAHDDPRLPR